MSQNSSSSTDTKSDPNKYVGHPLADKLSEKPDISLARNELNIPCDKKVIALLPGSRISEIKRIGTPLLKAASIAKKKHNDLFFVSSLNPRVFFTSIYLII